MREFDLFFSLEHEGIDGTTVIQDAMEKLAHGFAVWDAEMNIVLYSRKFLDLWGFTEEFLRENPNIRTMLRRILLKTGEATESEVDEIVESRISIINHGKDELLTILKSVDGRYIENHACRTSAGRWVITYTDITDRLKAEEEMTRIATYDQLTQVYNRFQFLKLAEMEHSRARRFGEHLPVMMLDLDHFKKINDSFGHAAGDATLVKVAETIQNCVRDYDIVGRIGGEEFAAIFPRTDWDDALRLAERIRMSVEKLEIGEFPDIRLSLSIGAAQALPDEENLDATFVRADMALYEAKGSGRNRVSFKPA